MKLSEEMYRVWREWVDKVAKLEAENDYAWKLANALHEIDALFQTHSNSQVNIDWIRDKVKQALGE